MTEADNCEQLLELMRRESFASADLEYVKTAFQFARDSYGDQKRASGATQIAHAAAVAMRLTEWHLTTDIIIAGLLHDILEYTAVTADDLREKFGHKVVRLVSGENLLDSLKYWGKEQYAENLRRMFLGMAEDVQIVFIKFADRIDNLKSLEYLPEEKRKRLAAESVEIYAAIAGRLGMEKIKQELEDLAFRHLNEKEYNWVNEIAEHYLKDNEKLIARFKNTVTEDAKKANIQILEINSRLKSLYSLFLKLVEHDRSVEKIFDILATRIVVKDIPSCYAILGIIHANFKPLPRRIKDYIAQPKPSGYRSLHTNVFVEGKVIEFQIRTPEMQHEAEYGIAAHWLYKESKSGAAKIGRRDEWLKELGNIQKELKQKTSLMQTLQSVKIDLFKNRIFVFTPKGDVIELPEGSSPIDFAYAVHAQLGDHCQSAIVNDMPVSLDCKLRSHDVVQIITGDKPAVNKNWLKIAITKRAKKYIKEATKNYVEKIFGN